MRLLKAPPVLASSREAGTLRLFVPIMNLEASRAPENVPPDLPGFLGHVMRNRFPADIEEQVEQAWD